jgi:adenylate kinase
VGSSAHEGVPGVGVAEMVDVVKNDLVRAHIVALKEMMMSFYCSYRNKNEPSAIYPSFG